MNDYADPLLTLDAILELQQLRMLARDYRRKGDKVFSQAAYRSARLLCNEIRVGLYERHIPRLRYRELLTGQENT